MVATEMSISCILTNIHAQHAHQHTYTEISGVQSAEALGYSQFFSNKLLTNYFLFVSSSRKISDDLFYLVINPNFSLFLIRFQISRKFAPWIPMHCPNNEIFLLLFLVIYMHFLRKLAP